MGCVSRIVRRRSVMAVGPQGETPPPVVDDGVTDAQIWMLHGTGSPAPLALPTPGPFFAATIAHFTEALMTPLRGSPDPVALYGPSGGSPAVAGVPTLERRWISERLRAGAVFDTARLTSVILVGSAAPNGSCLPMVNVYVVNSAGVFQASLLAGNFTGGVPYAAGNNYMHIIRGDLSAPYTTGAGDHLVFEFGVVGLVTVTGFGSQIGSRPQPYPSAAAVPMHVSGFNNVGNPGIRTPYLETDLVGWP